MDNDDEKIDELFIRRTTAHSGLPFIMRKKKNEKSNFFSNPKPILDKLKSTEKEICEIITESKKENINFLPSGNNKEDANITRKENKNSKAEKFALTIPSKSKKGIGENREATKKVTKKTIEYHSIANPSTKIKSSMKNSIFKSTDAKALKITNGNTTITSQTMVKNNKDLKSTTSRVEKILGQKPLVATTPTTLSADKLLHTIETDIDDIVRSSEKEFNSDETEIVQIKCDGKITKDKYVQTSISYKESDVPSSDKMLKLSNASIETEGGSSLRNPEEKKYSEKTKGLSRTPSYIPVPNFKKFSTISEPKNQGTAITIPHQSTPPSFIPKMTPNTFVKTQGLKRSKSVQERSVSQKNSPHQEKTKLHNRSITAEVKSDWIRRLALLTLHKTPSKPKSVDDAKNEDSLFKKYDGHTGLKFTPTKHKTIPKPFNFHKNK